VKRAGRRTKAEWTGYLEHIFEKLGASDRTAAVAEALRRHLIE